MHTKHPGGYSEDTGYGLEITADLCLRRADLVWVGRRADQGDRDDAEIGAR
jgi:hypothetical protein